MKNYFRVDKFKEMIKEKGKNLTSGDILSPAMNIIDKEEAKQYFEVYVDYLMVSFNNTLEKAVTIAKENLGYFAGYYDYKVMDRVNRLFETQHPIFGTSHPTSEEAFIKGWELAEKPKNESDSK